jgi:hypothetical protein
MEFRREHLDYRFRAEMVLANSDDLGRERLGLLPPEQVRRARVLARVDTRQCWPTVPRRLAEELQLQPLSWHKNAVNTAELVCLGRSTHIHAHIGPDDEVVTGWLVLVDLDLWPDAELKVLVPRDPHHIIVEHY